MMHTPLPPPDNSRALAILAVIGVVIGTIACLIGNANGWR